MTSLIGSTIAGTVMTVLLFGVFIFAVLDPLLPIYWKIIFGIISITFIYGSICTMKDQMNKLKKTYSNREDLR